MLYSSKSLTFVESNRSRASITFDSISRLHYCTYLKKKNIYTGGGFQGESASIYISRMFKFVWPSDHKRTDEPKRCCRLNFSSVNSCVNLCLVNKQCWKLWEFQFHLSALFFFVSFDLLFANNGIGRSKQSNQRDYISACVVYMMMNSTQRQNLQ